MVLESARLMKSLGLHVRLQSLETLRGLIRLQDVGYEYVGIDDCYSEKKRNDAGDIVASASFLWLLN